MKNKNLIVIFLSGVYQYLIPMLLYVLLPPPPPPPSPFCWGYKSFCIKNKLKSEIFKDRKSLYTTMFFWVSLTKNFVTFNFNIVGVHWKI